MQQDNQLRLLIADESLNDAEMLINVLRNNGYTVRATSAEDDEDVEQALAEKGFDVFVCNNGMEYLSIEQALNLVKAADKDVPVIVLHESDDPAKRHEFMQMGAVDLVAKDDLDQAFLVIKREFRYHQDRIELRRAKHALKETERRCHTLLDTSREAITYIHEGMHIYANNVYLEKMGMESFEDIEGMPFMDLISPDKQGDFKDLLKKFSKGDYSTNEVETNMVGADGNFPCTLDLSAATIDGEPCTQVLIRNRGNDEELAKQLDQMSKKDLMTGLFNRQFLIERLNEYISEYLHQDAPDSLGLTSIHIDKFPELKSTYGIQGVDKFIPAMAKVIQEKVGDNHLVARYGDNDFIVCLQKEAAPDVVALMETVKKSIEDMMVEVDGKTVTATVSVGVAMMSDRIDSSQELINKTEAACTEAINQGGNKVHFYNPVEDDPQDGSRSTDDWKQQIKTALEDNRFSLVYQPVVGLQNQPGERYEVRMRMKDENGELIMPAEFLEAAGKSGMMPKLDQWVVYHAILAMAEWRKTQPEGVFFVKLSESALTDNVVPAMIKAGLDKTGLPGDAFVFQMTEPAVFTHLTQAKELIDKIRSFGCGFSLDHFGSGLNSFQMLKHVEANYLKIDGSLTEKISESAENQDKVREIIATAHEKDTVVIASYVEEAMDLASLWQFGVDFVQGFFLQEPIENPDYDFNTDVF